MELRPGYKQSEIGFIPADWEIKGLLETVKIANGQVDPKVQPYRSLPLIAPDHIESGTGMLIETRTAEEQRAISGKYVFQPGDIVYSKIRPYLRKAILVNFQGLCSADMYPMTPAQGISGRYVLANLLAHRFTKYAESVSVRTGLPKINRAELSEFSIAVPRPREQRAIATVLSDVDAALAALERLIAKKRDLKQAAIQQLLTGQIRLPGFSGEWEIKRLGEIGATYGGLTGKSKSDFGVGSNYYITFMNVMANVVVDRDIFDQVVIGPYENQNTVRSGDLIFNGSSETADEVAMCAFVPFDAPNLFLNSFCFGFRAAQNEIDGLFMAYYFRSNVGREIVKSLAQGSTRVNISKRSLLEAEMRLPAPREQAAIAAVLSDMDAEIGALTARAEKTHLLKQAMMQELLTGRTRLPIPEDADA